MASNQPHLKKETLDKDLVKLDEVKIATATVSRNLLGLGVALAFLALSAGYAGLYVGGAPGAFTIIVAAAIGAYMAMNIGANDVANNVGPAVGSKAMTMGGALVIAAVCESAGALIAGGDVVGTISKGIINPASVADPAVFVAAMMAALVSSALWVNLATWVGAPVSTTHAIVGGVMGAGIAAAGLSAVNWPVMGGIAASWVVSPVLGGIIAAALLAFLKEFIIYQDDKIAAARRWVPVLNALMAGCFTGYLATKGLKSIIHLPGFSVFLIAFGAFLGTWMITHPMVRKQSENMENRNQSLRKLFRLPLIISAALLSFAHGANDVANAVGPLAAIVHTAGQGDVAAKVSIPIWVMVIGALGISVGLLLFGPKLIRMVGEQITKLNPMRAYCVALSAAVTVIIASWFGLPVSSTHIAVGAVFGVGFYREWYTANSRRRRAYLERKYGRWQEERSRTGLIDSAEEVLEFAETGNETGEPDLSREDAQRRRLVRRAHMTTIAAAWIVTVPASAILAGLLYFLISAIS